MTTLELLQQGCEIIFPNGYSLKGDTEFGYIEVAYYEGNIKVPNGLWAMAEKDLKFALDEAKNHNL